MDELLTVIVQTSPIPSHPSTALLEALFRSFEKADGLLESRILIVCDGCEIAARGEAENHKHGKASSETGERYRQHLELLRQAVITQQPPFAPHKKGSIELLELQERHGSARAIQAAFEHVTTPLIMVCQHDNFFVQTVPFRACVTAMATEAWDGVGVKCLHFLSTATLNYQQKVKKRYNIDITATEVELPLFNDDEPQQSMSTPKRKVKLVPLIFWYGRSHLSYTEHYRTNILNRPLQTGDHLEELLGVAQLEDIRQRGMEAAFGDYGTFVLDPGDGKEILYHLSGRRVRAATTHANSDNDDTETPLAPVSSTGDNSSNNPQAQPISNNTPAGSFTTARSCRAIVPGLEVVSDYHPASSPSSATMADTSLAIVKPKGRFKQKCFHCGEKGHSYKWCPNMDNHQTPATETIDLS